MITRNKVAESTTLKGLREIEEKDLGEVAELFSAYMARFELAPVMSAEEARHNFWSGRGSGDVDIQSGRREGQTTWTYVVEDPSTKRITDFFSFYTLPSTAIKTTPHQTINAAYLYYYATSSVPACKDRLSTSSSAAESASTSAVVSTSTAGLTTWDKESSEERKVLKDRLNELMADALIVANKNKFDVFNALTLMDNNLFLADQKVGSEFLSPPLQCQSICPPRPVRSRG